MISFLKLVQGPGGSMSQVVGLPNNPYKPITNSAWVRARRLCKLQKRCTRLAAASDKVYQLLAHSRCTLASSIIKTGRHDIAEILLKVALNTINQIKSNQISTCTNALPSEMFQEGCVVYSLVFRVVLYVDHCLSSAIVLCVLLRFMTLDYHFSLFELFVKRNLIMHLS